MANLLTTNDLNDFTNHELKVLKHSMRQQKDKRDELFIKQFTEGAPIAVTTNLRDEDNNFLVFPAYIRKVNKKSIDISFTVFNDYTPRKSWFSSSKRYSIDTLKVSTQYGYIRRAYPSTFMGRDGLYNTYPSRIPNNEY